MFEVVNIWGGERLGWWTSDFTQGVVNVWGGERLGWWASGVVNVWFYKGGGERLRWWSSEVVNIWGGERVGWWMSDFTLGVVNVWGGECLGGERLTIRKNSLLASSKMVKGSQRRILQVLIFSTSLPRCPCRPQCRRPSNYMYRMLSDMLKA